MGKFDKVRNSINEVKIKSNEVANEKKIIWIDNEKILDHPLNKEDITYVDDLIENIKKQGFTYELTVTSYGAPEGMYYIVSGHRRRKAGILAGYKSFPCIVKDYGSEEDVYEAILTGNGTRNSDRDPFFYSTRYEQWKDLLERQGYDGSIREEIALRLGCSVKQADKYRAFGNLIDEFKQIVRDGKCGRESLLTVAYMEKSEQRDFYGFLENHEIFKEKHISSENIRSLINVFRNKGENEIGKDILSFKADEEKTHNETYISIDGHNNNEKYKEYEDDIKRQREAAEYEEEMKVEVNETKEKGNKPNQDEKQVEENKKEKALIKAIKNCKMQFDNIEFTTKKDAHDMLYECKDMVNECVGFMCLIAINNSMQEALTECISKIKENLDDKF